MRIAIFFIALAALVSPAMAAGSQSACPPTNDGPKLISVEVFDGVAEDDATLAPDDGDQNNGVWQVAGIYQAGRFVTLRCNYADGTLADFPIKRKVSVCRSRQSGRVVSASCN